MNKEQLRTRTRQLAGAELDGLRSDEEVDLLIEEAYGQVGALTAWKWRESAGTVDTVIDQAEYTLPTEVDEPQGFFISDAPGHTIPVALHEVPLRDLLTRIDQSDTKLPRYYARTGSRGFRVGPSPDAVYTIQVYGLTPLDGLDTDASEPEWDSRFHPTIAYLAASVFLDEEGQDELALHRRGRYEELVTDMIEFYQQSRDTTPIQMGAGQSITRPDRLGRIFPW